MAEGGKKKLTIRVFRVAFLSHKTHSIYGRVKSGLGERGRCIRGNGEISHQIRLDANAT